jgi:hypothetical protein
MVSAPEPAKPGRQHGDCRRALQHHGDARADPRRAQAPAAAFTQQAAQRRLLAALDAGPDHAHRPQQQGDGAGEVQKEKVQIHAGNLSRYGHL